jgi:hypothetical protein
MSMSLEEAWGNIKRTLDDYLNDRIRLEEDDEAIEVVDKTVKEITRLNENITRVLGDLYGTAHVKLPPRH